MERVYRKILSRRMSARRKHRGPGTEYRRIGLLDAAYLGNEQSDSLTSLRQNIARPS